MAKAKSPKKDVDLSRRLSRVLRPRDRPDLVTLLDAALLIDGMDEWRQARPVWTRAVEMILQAGKTGTAADLDAATRQLYVALRQENWIEEE